MTLRQSALSLEYVLVPVTTLDAADPTTDAVSMAFTATTVAPVSGDWKTASWQTSGGTHYARCLVGPGGAVTLTAGWYQVWVKLTDTPEVPAKPAGSLVIF